MPVIDHPAMSGVKRSRTMSWHLVRKPERQAVGRRLGSQPIGVSKPYKSTATPTWIINQTVSI